MIPFTQTGFNTPFSFNNSPFFGGFGGFPFNQNFTQPFGWNSTPWNTPFNGFNGFNAWNPSFSGGFGGFGAGFQGGFNSPWNFASSWSTPFNGFWSTPFNTFGGFSPFASFPFWNGVQGFNWNNAQNGATTQENTPFNASAPVNGVPFGFPFFAPGPFGPFGAPTGNGDAITARNAA